MLPSPILLLCASTICLHITSGSFYGVPPLQMMRKIHMRQLQQRREQQLLQQRLQQQQQQQPEEYLPQTEDLQEEEEVEVDNGSNSNSNDNSEPRRNSVIGTKIVREDKPLPMITLLRGAFLSRHNRPSYEYNFVG